MSSVTRRPVRKSNRKVLVGRAVRRYLRGWAVKFSDDEVGCPTVKVVETVDEIHRTRSPLTCAVCRQLAARMPLGGRASLARSGLCALLRSFNRRQANVAEGDHFARTAKFAILAKPPNAGTLNEEAVGDKGPNA